MAQEDLVPWGAGELGEQAIAASFATLLATTYDAVMVLDASGWILLANDEAQELFRSEGVSLVGTNVRLVFPPAATVPAMKGPLEDSLPFGLDGSTTPVTCETKNHEHLGLLVRCSPVQVATTRVYVLVAHRGGDEPAAIKRDRLVEDLSRANKRLSGTLKIVLGTLDSLDVGTLFSRVLDQLTETMDAWATFAYVSETSGFRLRGQTESVGDAFVPVFLAQGSTLVDLASRVGQAACYRVSAPSRDDLRRGSASMREVVDVRSGLATKVPASELPPFSTFVLLPVWFGGHIIALMEVGWRHAHRLREDDTRLLDAVAEYLSVQLAGAFAAFRAQRAEKLESLSTTLREQLLSHEQITAEVLANVFAQAAEGVDATSVMLQGNPYQRATVGTLTDYLGVTNIPIDLDAISRAKGLPFVGMLEDMPELLEWVTANSDYGQGIVVAACAIDEIPYGCLLLRKDMDEPFEDEDVSFVSRLAEDVSEVMEGERVRSQDKRIAQALQRGMRSELQHVDGLSAQSCYSSATEAALVGGDFYDLIRLPDRRACVIMGDVSGKGVEAASVSSAVKTALGAYSWEGLRPARMVSLLNEFLLGFARVETFATLFVGMVDLEAGRITYCSAGHPPALLVRACTGELVTLGVQSGVVGAFSGMAYRDGEVAIAQGDVLLLYTDGVTEARNLDGAFFGEDGLGESVARQAAMGFEGLCDRVLSDVRDFAGRSLNDDVALLALRLD